MYTELKTALVKRSHRDDLIRSLETLLDLSLVHVDIQGTDADEQQSPSRQYCGMFHLAGAHACQVHGSSIGAPGLSFTCRMNRPPPSRSRAGSGRLAPWKKPTPTCALNAPT